MPPHPDPTAASDMAGNTSVSASLPKANPNLSIVEAAKRLAAYKAVEAHVKPTDKVIGVGSGSTVVYVVEALLTQDKKINDERVFIPTGFQSKELIIEGGLTLGDVDQFPVIDITLDGADEVDPYLNCIKGGGACHLREKVVAGAAKKFIITADYRKISMALGTKWTQGVPVEVAPFAYLFVLKELQKLGCKEPVLRMGGTAKQGPVVTDNGNFVIDAPFGAIADPDGMLASIKLITGVLEVGIFPHMADAAYFGLEDGSVQVQEKVYQEGSTDKFEIVYRKLT